MRTQTNMRSGEAGPHSLVGDELPAARAPFRVIVHTVNCAWARRILFLMSAAIITPAQMCLSADTKTSRLTWTQLPSMPDKSGIGGCLAGASGEALLVAGGCNFPDKKIWGAAAKTEARAGAEPSRFWVWSSVRVVPEPK